VPDMEKRTAKRNHTIGSTAPALIIVQLECTLTAACCLCCYISSALRMLDAYTSRYFDSTNI